MGSFEEIVEKYAQKSIDFVKLNEGLFYKVLSEFYSVETPDFFTQNLRFSKDEFEDKGIETLVLEKKHLPIVDFYCGIAEKIKEQILSESKGKDKYVNAFFAALFGFRLDIESIELEREYSANQDLSDDRLVEYLLKLRGLFGARAFTTFKGHSLNMFNITAKERSLVMQFISSYTIDLLRNQEDLQERLKKRKKTQEGDLDIDISGDTDF